MSGEIRTHRVAVSDVELFVREAGPGDAPPLLLLHGWPESSRGWDPLIPELGGSHRLLMPDNRGFGRSGMPAGTGAYGMPTLVGDVVAVLDAVGLEQASIAGHDFGGAVAWAAGVLAPDRVARMVVLAAPHPMSMHRVGAGNLDQLSRAFYAWLMNVGEAGERLLAADGFRFLERFAFASNPSVSEEVRAAYRAEWSEPGRFHAMAEWYRANYRPDLFNPDIPLELPPVQVPVRYVHGGRDWAFVPELASGHGAFVAADYDEVLLEECSHWMIHEQPARVAELIAEWVEQ